MNAGDYRERVSIQTRTESDDGHGAHDETWTTVQARIAAQVVELAGRDLERAWQIDARATHEVRLRYWRAHNDSLKGGRAQVIWHDDGALGDRTLEIIGPAREVERVQLVLLTKENR